MAAVSTIPPGVHRGEVASVLMAFEAAESVSPARPDVTISTGVEPEMPLSLFAQTGSVTYKPVQMRSQTNSCQSNSSP